MGHEDETDSTKKWAAVKSGLPEHMRILAESGNAFSTEFTGLTVYEGTPEQWEKAMRIIRERGRRMLEASMTVMDTRTCCSDCRSQVSR
ncbi:MAG: hypothetical protein HXY34_03880 [Candidatus Thorarchaeota archaeon]|nr:hypothetical protein [Candidatus Thorarchaeota archaeon]